MDKAGLIEAIAQSTGLSENDSKKVLDAFIKAITTALKEGDRVALSGFGTWSVTKRTGCMGVNPLTGKQVMIARRRVVKFKAGKGLCDE
jgi:DNA-binding protein HU-beta